MRQVVRLQNEQVVYIDVLFIVNLILNYFILLAVSAALHRRDSRWRLFGAACLGAVYALFIFFPALGFLYTATAKFVFSLSIVLAAFRFTNLRGFLKVTLCFYVVTIAFGGIIFAIWMFFSPPGMQLRNGVVYFDISPVWLILCGGGCYVVVLLLSRFLHRSNPTRTIYQLAVKVGNLSAAAPALLDTGNGLCDVMTGAPVVVAEYARMEKLIPHALRPSFRKGTLESGALSGSPWAQRVRMVPYGGLGGKGGLLPAFRPDSVTAENGKQTVETKSVLVAVTPGRLSDDGSFGALLSPHLFSEIKAG